ncbi:MAG: hypothetical protein M1833_006576 [Piccolia ochrophora]|nr:MAG: hypothetical protein M1833_006576 [Piccolia ochrophora]
MSRSTDAGHFFQTEDSLATTARKASKADNTHGRPIKLRSKILALHPDPTSPTHVYVAESAGIAQRVALETGTQTHTYRGPAAPLTDLALSPTSTHLAASCWDKAIWIWDAASTKLHKKLRNGHTDFVKAVLWTQLAPPEDTTNDSASRPPIDILISAGADARIVIWDVSAGTRLHTLTAPPPTLSIHALALDPSASTPDALLLLSAGSDPHIRRWRISLSRAVEVEAHDGPAAIVEHDTGVYALAFAGDDDDELWTASADKTARCLARHAAWATDTRLEHPDYVRDVVVSGQWVFTACRDEEVRVWDRGTATLHTTFTGHHEEVTCLALALSSPSSLTKSSPKSSPTKHPVLVSGSIDGTLRQWPISTEALSGDGVGVDARDVVGAGVIEGKQDAIPAERGSVTKTGTHADGAVGVEAVGTHGEDKGKGQEVMTAEEERELEELMGLDDD